MKRLLTAVILTTGLGVAGLQETAEGGHYQSSCGHGSHYSSYYSPSYSHGHYGSGSYSSSYRYGYNSYPGYYNSGYYNSGYRGGFSLGINTGRGYNYGPRYYNSGYYGNRGFNRGSGFGFYIND